MLACTPATPLLQRTPVLTDDGASLEAASAAVSAAAAAGGEDLLLLHNNSCSCCPAHHGQDVVLLQVHSGRATTAHLGRLQPSLQQQQQQPVRTADGAATVPLRSAVSSGSSTHTRAASQWGGLRVVAPSPPAPPAAPWQLQRGAAVPLLLAGWLERQVAMLLGRVTACLVLRPADDQLQHADQGPEAAQLHLLAAMAAATVAAAGVSQPDTHGCIVPVTPPVVCTPSLLQALAGMLPQHPQQQQPAAHAGGGNGAATPPCLLLIATSGGQLWLADPMQVLRGLQQPPPHEQQQHQQQHEHQQQRGAGLKLLLNLQQPILAVLPVSASAHGTPALLAVGALGRLLLLQPGGPPPQQQQQQQQQQGLVAPALPALTVTQQLQLPFAVAAAAVAANGSNSSAAAGPSSQPPPPLLLLLSPGGSLYAASLGLTAAEQGVAPDTGLQLSQLHPLQLQLPVRAGRFWLSDGGGGGALGGSPACILVQPLWSSGGSSELLLQVPLSSVTAAVAPQATAAAGDAAHARARLRQLLGALDMVAAARRQLEQATVEQVQYLQHIQQDTELLANAPTDAQQQQPKPLLSCTLQLQGLWPAAVQTQADHASGSSMQLAVNARLHVSGSSSSSGASFAGWQDARSKQAAPSASLGPGWQLLICFVPESASSSSWQTTISLDSLATASLACSMLLPLPPAVCRLEEGGWLNAFAVKQPPAGSAGSSSCAPAVVTLLQQRHVSVLQLAHLAAANPASRLLLTPKLPTTAWPAGMQQGPAASVACMLRLVAACPSVGPDAAAGQQLPAAKRARSGEAAGGRGSIASAAAFQAPGGDAEPEQLQWLGRWVSQALSAGSGSSAEGQVSHRLASGSVVSASWASPDGGWVPAHRLLATVGPQQQHSDPAAGVSLDVRCEGSTAASLAHAHRALLLRLVGELEAAAVGASSSSSLRQQSGWRLTASHRQLKAALARLRQLQQHMLLMQDTGDAAREAAVVFRRGSSSSSLDSEHLRELIEQLAAWRVGVEAGYGQLLLAAAEAASVHCCPS